MLYILSPAGAALRHVVELEAMQMEAPVERWRDMRVADHMIGSLRVCLETVQDFDPLLDRYAARYPDDTDMIPYYATLWPSALALARHLAEFPSSLQSVRVVELGCGLGLPSIVAALRGAVVLATDFHPDNAPYVARNADLNGVALRYSTLRWGDPVAEAPFELVLCSDVLYERRHVAALVECAAACCAPGGAILLADPGRDALASAARALRERGFVEDLVAVDNVFLLHFKRPLVTEVSAAVGSQTPRD